MSTSSELRKLKNYEQRTTNTRFLFGTIDPVRVGVTALARVRILLLRRRHRQSEEGVRKLHRVRRSTCRLRRLP